jgi:hypothetical protein
MGPKEYKDMMDYLTRPRMANGGRMGFQEGTPIRFDKTRVKIPTGEFIGEGRDKSQIFKIKNNTTGSVRYTTSGAGGGKKKLYESIEEVKKAKLDFIPDELIKTDSKRIKENIQEVTYKNKKTGKITTKYKPFIGPDKVTIPGQGANTLKEAEGFVADYFKKNPKTIRVRDPKKDYKQKDIRRQFEKDLQGRTIKFGAPKGYTAHHMLPLAGKADVTDSDIAIISNKMNAELAQFDKPMNKLVNEAYALDFSKEGSLKRMDEINKELAEIVKKSENKLPKKYKGLIGFNKLTPVLGEFDAKGNQVFDMERIGADYKKSIGGKKIGTPLRDIKTKEIIKQVSDAPKFKATIPVIENIMDVAKSIPGDIAKKSYFKAAGKALGLAFTPVMLYDTYKALEQGKPLLESLEQGLIGTDLIGGTKRIVALTPEERTARSVVKQDELKDLNLDMPMGFGFIEGPTPDSDLTLEEAQAKAAAGADRVKQLEAQTNFDRANKRANFFGNLRDRAFGIGPDYQLELAGGGIAKIAGVDKGPPPKSGPMSQGLQGLMKRVRNL